jgi:O-acetyl-ADP-ribose deacetylase
LAQCRALRDGVYADGLPAGQAVATTAGRLHARWVIHTVGPVYSTSADRSAILASCYRSSLQVADHLGARSVAFPAISAGIYRWPINDAARIAIGTVKSTDTKVQDIRFVLFGPEAYGAFSQHL